MLFRFETAPSRRPHSSALKTPAPTKPPSLDLVLSSHT